MRKRTRKIFAVIMAVTTCVFAVMGSGCSSVSDWVKDKYDQLTCEHLTEKFIPAVAPTCTEKGSTEGIECADCGKVLTEPSEVAALGHTLEHYEALEATCMQTGLTEGEYCTVCEEWIVEQDTVKRTGHKVVTVRGKRPTCTETGLTDGQACDHCGVVYVAQKEIPMIEHYYSNGVCLNCGEVDFSAYLGENVLETSVAENEIVKTRTVYYYERASGLGFYALNLLTSDGTTCGTLECKIFGLLESPPYLAVKITGLGDYIDVNLLVDGNLGFRYLLLEDGSFFFWFEKTEVTVFNQTYKLAFNVLTFATTKAL